MSEQGLGQVPTSQNPNPSKAQMPSGAGGSGGQQNPTSNTKPQPENPPGQAVDPETGEPLNSPQGK